MILITEQFVLVSFVLASSDPQKAKGMSVTDVPENCCGGETAVVSGETGNSTLHNLPWENRGKIIGEIVRCITSHGKIGERLSGK